MKKPVYHTNKLLSFLPNFIHKSKAKEKLEEIKENWIDNIQSAIHLKKLLNKVESLKQREQIKKHLKLTTIGKRYLDIVNSGTKPKIYQKFVNLMHHIGLNSLIPKASSKQKKNAKTLLDNAEQRNEKYMQNINITKLASKMFQTNNIENIKNLLLDLKPTNYNELLRAVDEKHNTLINNLKKKQKHKFFLNELNKKRNNIKEKIKELKSIILSIMLKEVYKNNIRAITSNFKGKTPTLRNFPNQLEKLMGQPPR